VEHIQPKEAYPELEGCWDNFLLACINCNSTKGHKRVAPEAFYLPDRDNTLRPFVYTADGSVESQDPTDQMASNTLELTGLHKTVREVRDDNGRLIAADRISQRREAWLIAERAKNNLRKQQSPELIEAIITNAVLSGFFSVWMTVFHDQPEMRRRFIASFPGTADSCFDPVSTDLVPRPPNGLVAAGKR
jgi:hypothetical protein